MSDIEKKLRILQLAFVTVVLLSIGLTFATYTNYISLLKTMNEVVYTIDSMSHSTDENKVEVSITFSILNPTSYSQIKFSSLQCQLYLLVDGKEEYIGTTGYAPPVGVPLRPEEARTYITKLSVSRETIDFLSVSVLEPELGWKVRNVIYFLTPIRKYYQIINIYHNSKLLESN